MLLQLSLFKIKLCVKNNGHGRDNNNNNNNNIYTGGVLTLSGFRNGPVLAVSLFYPIYVGKRVFFYILWWVRGRRKLTFQTFSANTVMHITAYTSGSQPIYHCPLNDTPPIVDQCATNSRFLQKSAVLTRNNNQGSTDSSDQWCTEPEIRATDAQLCVL